MRQKGFLRSKLELEHPPVKDGESPPFSGQLYLLFPLTCSEDPAIPAVPSFPLRAADPPTPTSRGEQKGHGQHLGQGQCHTSSLLYISSRNLSQCQGRVCHFRKLFSILHHDSSPPPLPASLVINPIFCRTYRHSEGQSGPLRVKSGLQKGAKINFNLT